MPWYPGDWIWPVLAALLVAAIAAGIAIAATNDKSGTNTKAAINSPPPAQTGTNPGSPPPGGTGSTSTLPPPTSTLPTEPPATQPPPPPSSGGGLTEWPAGQNGWTIVLASVPQSSGRAAATREANKASSGGLSDVGVLNSSEFSSLHSGYFVVFSGVYNSESEARGALGTAKSSYPQAYVRQIVQ